MLCSTRTIVSENRFRIALNQIHQFACFLRVHPGGRFVQQQQLRFGRKRPGDLEAALTPVRQTRCRLIGHGIELEDAKQLDRTLAFLTLLAVVACGAQHGLDEPLSGAQMLRGHDVLENRHVGKQPDVLKRSRDASMGNLVRGTPIDASPVEVNLSFGRLIDPRQQIEDRRLACAVRADQSVECAARHLERQILHGRETAEPFGDLPRVVKAAGRLLGHRCNRSFSSFRPSSP